MTHLHDIVDPDHLARGVADKLINARESGDGLTILNYTAAAMYTPGAWDNPAVRACRGLIHDTAGTVLARPWAKFFNHSQPEAGELELTAAVEVTDKIDGSLGIIHPRPDGTRGLWPRAGRSSPTRPFTPRAASTTTGSTAIRPGGGRCSWRSSTRPTGSSATTQTVTV